MYTPSNKTNLMMTSTIAKINITIESGKGIISSYESTIYTVSKAVHILLMLHIVRGTEIFQILFRIQFLLFLHT